MGEKFIRDDNFPTTSAILNLNSDKGAHGHFFFLSYASF